AFTLEMKQNLLTNCGNISTAQPTLASTTVQVSLQFLAPLTIILNLKQRRPFTPQRDRKRIREVICDELRKPGRIAMRKITPFVPTAKSLPLIFITRPSIPRAFSFNQIAHTRIIGWTWKSLF